VPDVTGDSEATSIVSMPQIDTGLQIATMVEFLIAVQIRVIHASKCVFMLMYRSAVQLTSLASALPCTQLSLVPELLRDQR
jgi:hypothetical protein